MPVQLGAVPAVEGRHHHLRAGGQRPHMAFAVDLAQSGFRARGVALVDAAGAAVADEVLGGGEHLVGGQEAFRAGGPLQTSEHAFGEGADDGRIFGVALVGAAPAVVAHHRQGRREGPVDAGGRNLRRGRRADPLQQGGVAGGAETDVVREDGGAEDVVVAMHGVRAPQHGYAGGGRQRRLVMGVGQAQPIAHRGALVAVRPRTAAVQHRPQRVFAGVVRREIGDLPLQHLADLRRQGHGGEQAADFGLHTPRRRPVRIDRTRRARPISEWHGVGLR